MLYHIRHTTTYTYSQPVRLQPHVLRLRPRSDGLQTLQSFDLQVGPTPLRQCQLVELDGNALIKLWFAPEPVEQLCIETRSQVVTHLTNPFDYLLEPWAIRLPIDYPSSLLGQLQPYLSGQLLPHATAVDPVAVQLAQALLQSSEGDVLTFLSSLNQRIYSACSYQLRETGDPLPAGVTWQQRTGSCRDFAVLFCEVCRAIGLAARFVSGYQAGDPDSTDRQLHAWAEVYLPGGGWRGYDPTQGLAVAGGHIALVATPQAHRATPIAGSFEPAQAVQSQMVYDLAIERPEHHAEAPS